MANRDYIVLGQIDHQDLKLGEVRAVMKTPELEEVTVKSKEIVQEILPTEGKYIKKVIVDSVAIDKPDQSKTLYPSTIRQTVIADAGYDLYSVTLEPVTSNIDSNIKARNIKRGINILGVDGEFDGGELQSKTITPTTSEQLVQPDGNYYGLSGVKVEAVNPSDYYKDEESLNVTPSTESQKITPTANKVFNEVNVSPVTSAIDTNIVAGNIKKDVTILGVTGTLEQGGAEDLTEELTAQDTALTNLESAVDKLPEPKPDRLQWKCDNIKSLSSEFSGYTGTDLDEVLVGLDTSQVASMNNMCNNCTKITTIPPLDTRNVTDFGNAFNRCLNLTTISLLNVIKATNLYSMLSSCVKLTNLTLKNITISLVIGSYTVYGHLLTDESLINTAKELWDKTGVTSQTLTVSTTSDARFDAIYVKLIEATADMIANDEYITNKKPCVVCESTDEGAMTLREYVVSKNWVLAK